MSVHSSGAGSRRVAPLLTGPPRVAEIRGVFPAAVYLDTGDTVVALVARDAVRLPIAVVIAAATQARPFRNVNADDRAVVGGGRVIAGSVEVQVRRWWSPPRVPPATSGDSLERSVQPLADLLRARRRTLAPILAGRLAELTAALQLRTDISAAAAALVGLGNGLTPAGDDVLSGVLLALRVLGRPGDADELWAVIAGDVHRRTTALSAALLHAAADGDAIAPAAELVAALGAHRALEPSLDQLLAVGATSGADLAHGLTAGAKVVATLGRDGRS